MSTDLQRLQAGGERQMPVPMSFFNVEGFELMQRIAKAFSTSDLVPKQYQQNLPNCMIALDMAQRIGANPLMVMQNLYVVHGNPGWSSKFLIATVNTCGRFSALRYEWKGEPGTPEYGCRAWAKEKETGERLDGIWVTWAMVKAEGWSNKSGSKWNTMADQMFIYRAAAFWQRGYAPDLAMGLQTVEEVKDVFDAGKGHDGVYTVTTDELARADVIESSKVDKKTGEIATSSADVEVGNAAKAAALDAKKAQAAEKKRKAEEEMARQPSEAQEPADDVFPDFNMD